MAFVFGLVTLSACGVESGGADESESSEAAPTTGRTGGIFGGSVQPRASRDAAGSSSAPLSTPDGSSGSRSGSGGAPAGSGTGGGASGSDEQGQVTAGEFDVTDMGYTVGAPDAPIQVIEFSDFGCGFCRRFHLNTYPALHEEYVETDRVAWKYIPFVLGIFPNGEEAAIAGECVLRHGRRSFPEFRNRLFEDQGAWRDSDDPASVFVEVGSEAGVDPAPLRRCIEEEGTAEQVRANNAVGQRIGLRGTPSFLINGFPLHGAQPAMVFRNIFDDMLRQAR
ncbi:MAG: DsbA family protein [Longimicrobiales bacterium]